MPEVVGYQFYPQNNELESSKPETTELDRCTIQYVSDGSQFIYTYRNEIKVFSSETGKTLLETELREDWAIISCVLVEEANKLLVAVVDKDTGKVKSKTSTEEDEEDGDAEDIDEEAQPFSAVYVGTLDLETLNFLKLYEVPESDIDDITKQAPNVAIIPGDPKHFIVSVNLKEPEFVNVETNTRVRGYLIYCSMTDFNYNMSKKPKIIKTEFFVKKLEFSFDGSLFSGVYDVDLNDKNIVPVWSTESGEKVIELGGHLWTPTDIAFANKSNKIVSISSFYELVLIWDLTFWEKDLEEYAKTADDEDILWKPVREIKLKKTKDPQIVSFSADDKFVVVAATGNAFEKRATGSMNAHSEFEPIEPLRRQIDEIVKNDIYHSKLMFEKKRRQFHPATSFAMTKSATFVLLTADVTGVIRLWNIDHNKDPRRVQKLHRQPVLGLSYLPGENRLLMSGSGDCSVRLWSVETGENVRCFETIPRGCNYINFSTDDPNLFAMCSDSGDIRISSLDGGTIVTWDLSNKPMKKVLFAPGTNASYIAFAESFEEIFDKKKQRMRLLRWKAKLPASDDKQKIARLADLIKTNKDVYVTLEGEHGISKKKDLNINDFAFSHHPKGAYIAACRNTRFAIWDTKTAKMLAEFKSPRGVGVQFKRIEFHLHDPSILCLGDSSGHVYFWQWKNGKLEKLCRSPKTKDFESRLEAIAFSNTDRDIMLTARNDVLYAWNIRDRENMELMYSLHGLEGIYQVVFPSNDGSTFACCTEDQTIYVYATYSGHLLMKTGPDGAQFPASFENGFAQKFGYYKDMREKLLENFYDYFDNKLDKNTPFTLAVVGDKYFTLSIANCAQIAFIPRHTKGIVLKKIFHHWNDRHIDDAEMERLVRFCVEDCYARNPQNLYYIFEGLVEDGNVELLKEFFKALPSNPSFMDSTVFLGIFPWSRKCYPMLSQKVARLAVARIGTPASDKTVINKTNKLTLREAAIAVIYQNRSPNKNNIFPETSGNNILDMKTNTLNKPKAISFAPTSTAYADEDAWEYIMTESQTIFPIYVDYILRNPHIRWTVRNDVTIFQPFFKRLAELSTHSPEHTVKLLNYVSFLESRTWTKENAHHFVMEARFVSLNSNSHQIDLGREIDEEEEEEEDPFRDVSAAVSTVSLKSSVAQSSSDSASSSKSSITNSSDSSSEESEEGGHPFQQSKFMKFIRQLFGLKEPVHTANTDDMGSSDSVVKKHRKGAKKKVTAVPCIIPIENFHGRPFAKFIENAPNLDFYRSKTIQEILKFKWTMYGKKRYEFFIFLYVLWMFFFFIIHYGILPNQYVTFTWDNQTGINIVGIGSTIVFIGLTVFFCVLEAIQFTKIKGSSYWKSIVNLQDLGSYMFSVAVTILRIALRTFTHSTPDLNLAITILLSGATLIMFFKLLHHLKPFQETGQFIRMTLEITKQITWLLLLLGIILFAFVQLFLAAVDPASLDTVPKALETQGRLFIQSYFMLISQSGVSDLETIVSEGNVAIIKGLYILFTGFVIILLLNLLISIMGYVSEQVQGNLEPESFKSIASALVEVEQTLMFNASKNTKFFPKFMGYYIKFEKYQDFISEKRKQQHQELIDSIYEDGDDGALTALNGAGGGSGMMLPGSSGLSMANTGTNGSGPVMNPKLIKILKHMANLPYELEKSLKKAPSDDAEDFRKALGAFAWYQQQFYQYLLYDVSQKYDNDENM